MKEDFCGHTEAATCSCSFLVMEAVLTQKKVVFSINQLVIGVWLNIF